MKISFELLKNGLGILLDLSWTPLKTLWGGVLGPLGRFGAALGRPSGAQELILGFCKASKRAPRGSQRGGKGIQGNFICSETLQDPPNGPQDPPNGPQEAPKRLPRGSQEGAKTFLSVSSEVMKKRSKFVSNSFLLDFQEVPHAFFSHYI